MNEMELNQFHMPRHAKSTSSDSILAPKVTHHLLSHIYTQRICDYQQPRICNLAVSQCDENVHRGHVQM